VAELDIDHLPGADGAIDLGVMRELPGVLPALPLREAVAFPDTLTPLAVGQERSIKLVNDVLAGCS
jgi:ATP-dependent Lon protease